jgi:poly-gamma-glutamate capsule biosynthesis protein CapA/YwtB (metallophosphatase superfamily)
VSWDVPAALPEPAPTVFISVASVGDMMLGTDYPENHLPDDDGISFLADVAELLRAPDLTIGNLEGVLMDGGTPRKECQNPHACYLFRTPARYARYLVDAGFDVMSLANNHARDFGEDGRSASMRNLAAAGLAHTGREGDFAFLQTKGLKVAVLGYAVTLNSNLVLDYEIAAATVSEIAAENDIVIITFHGGAEGTDTTRLPFAEETYFGEMRGDVVRFARLMVDAGADLVVGHGPHVVRGMECYKDRLIAYSLGNFATYYGISVDGIKGIAPILVATLNNRGRFVEGKIHSTIQLRPAGPSIDPD